MASRTGVVTPEGVFLDYRPAGLATRTVGKLIDVSLQILMAYALLTALLLSFAVSGVGTVFIVGATVIAVFDLVRLPGSVRDLRWRPDTGTPSNRNPCHQNRRGTGSCPPCSH